ncbi:hybrid sensor histidine kinase/response regulator [Geopseudomonas guangdongensis]|uniref:histidine kinase n=1 Tax=Geopseudomonas guangdongensis TaxID=1245526 RepID=A0A1H2I7M2_9GAMM|nr:ATP-binding protein [Pseudomonas guangdongensis]SDU39858.1 Signal transduction histidine kinase [Pseudomonas guangdongensis]
MQDTRKTTLRRWMWRAFVQSSLIPLILVETVLIAAYLLTNSSIREAQIDHLRQTALTDLQSAAQQEGRLINERLRAISRTTRLYGEQIREVLLREDYQVDEAERRRHAHTEDGVLYTRSNDGRAASFYANSTPRERQDMERVLRLAQLDPLMKSIQASDKLIASLYFNTWDSYNRIYPWFFTPDQYPHDMVIPDYNFYYLADARHNPQRKVVWTEIYVDPAGQGWMMSALAPVYRGDFLEGVAGLDVTVDTILDEIATLQVPWNGYAILVSEELNIMALPPAGERDFNLSELTSHSYDEAIRKEIFKPADFNLAKREDTQALAGAIGQRASGLQTLSLGGKSQLAAWTTIGETGWKLVTLVDEAEVFRQTNALAARYQQIGYLLIAGLVLFYVLFFAGMWLRARQLSAQLQGPIDHLSAMMGEIGRGNWHPPRQPCEIGELDGAAAAAAAMGAQLECSETTRQQAQDQLDLVLDSTTESLWTLDLRRQRLHIEGRFPQRFGLDGNDLALDAFLARVHPDDREAVIACHEQPAASSDNYSIEYRFSDAHGIYHWLLSRARLLDADPVSGRPLRLAGTHVDIDALKATQEALSRASQQAQAANVAKTRFLSSMSHELRTPLNAVQGFAQLIQLELQERPEEHSLRQYAGEIDNASSHLGLLVDDILDLARIEADKASVHLETVDARQIMAECLELIRPQAREQHLQLEAQLPPGSLLVRAEARRLRQILLNLLSNAVKYNRPHGRVTLGYRIDGERLRLSVEDSGYGIDPERQDQLFKPFQRLGHENSAIKGSGIGLVLSRELAELMHGRIGFVSTPGSGSTFWIELPFSAELQASVRSAAAPGRERLPRVLYVEDNRASQLLVEKALGDIARVEVLDNGLEALHWLNEHPPQLLLLDLDLPGLQGDALLRRLRDNPQTRELPVIIISAAAMPEDIANISALGIAGYLTKPLKIQTLREAVLQLCGRARQAS